MKKSTIEGSGNVFADLGLPNADTCLEKADIVYQINKIIRQRNLTQVEAAKILGIDQPQVSALLNGRFYRFSLERLLRFMNALGKRLVYSFEDKDEKSFRTFSAPPRRRAVVARR